MLVLSRRTNEVISFPSLGITLKILKVKGKAVTVGIEAPDDIQILRGELVESATGFSDTTTGDIAGAPKYYLPKRHDCLKVEYFAAGLFQPKRQNSLKAAP